MLSKNSNYISAVPIAVTVQNKDLVSTLTGKVKQRKNITGTIRLLKETV